MGSCQITYGAVKCSSLYWTAEAEQEYWFSEPMIELYFRNKEREEEYKKNGGYMIDGVPLYELGYRVAYSIDGKLALEEGKWFLEDDKEEFCKKYVEAMQQIIGKK